MCLKISSTYSTENVGSFQDITNTFPEFPRLHFNSFRFILNLTHYLDVSTPWLSCWSLRGPYSLVSYSFALNMLEEFLWILKAAVPENPHLAVIWTITMKCQKWIPSDWFTCSFSEPIIMQFYQTHFDLCRSSDSFRHFEYSISVAFTKATILLRISKIGLLLYFLKFIVILPHCYMDTWN